VNYSTVRHFVKLFPGIGAILFIVALTPSKGSSQYIIEALPRWMVSAHATYQIPQSPVDMFLNDGQLGYHVEAQYRLQYNKPFLGGLYFSESFLSKYVLNYSYASPEGNVNVREKATTRRLEFGLTAGFYPEINWFLQPYIQGRAGMAIFQTSSVVTDSDTDENIERISESKDSALSYGIDFGIHIVPKIWYIRGDIRIGFVANPSATFMSLDEENKGTTGFPIDYFEKHTSSANWFKVSAGVSYLF
jgi:hypothetical protein